VILFKKLTEKLQNHVLKIKTIMVKDGISMLRKTDVLLICHDVDRGVNFRGKAYSPLIDSVREDFESRGLHCLVIAHPWSWLVGRRAWGEPLSISRSFFLAYIISKINRLKLLKSNNEDFRFRFYAGILKKSAAKLVITIGAPESLCRATQSLGVCHAELLHGIGYTNVEWDWDKRHSSALPTFVLSFDSISTATFSKLEPKGVEVLQIPHPFLKRFTAKDGINKLPQEWTSPTIKSLAAYKKIVMVALQWGYGGEFPKGYKPTLDNELFPSELLDVIQETKNDIFWRFRFHPVQLRMKKYKKHIQFVDKLCRENSNCEWKWSSSAPVPTVLSQCQGTITMSSMSVYDAAYMGVPSLLLCPTMLPGGIGDERFVDLVNAGYVTKGAIIKKDIHQWVLSTNKMEPLAVGLDNEDAWEYAINRMLGDSAALSVSNKTK
jgi:hypothetical protein